MPEGGCRQHWRHAARRGAGRRGVRATVGVLADGQPPSGSQGVGGAHRAQCRGFVWRRRARELPLGDHDAAAPGSGASGLDSVVLIALRRLPARQREVIVLRVFLDLDIQSTARQLGIEAGTVRMHLSRGIACFAARTHSHQHDGGRAMNIHDDISDDDVLNRELQPPRCRRSQVGPGPLRQSRSSAAGPCTAPPHRGRAGRAGWHAGVAVLALGVGGVFGGHSAAPPQEPRSARQRSPSPGTPTARPQLTLSPGTRQFDPTALQQASAAQTASPPWSEIGARTAHRARPRPRRTASGSSPSSCRTGRPWGHLLLATSNRFPPMPSL